MFFAQVETYQDLEIRKHYRNHDLDDSAQYFVEFTNNQWKLNVVAYQPLLYSINNYFQNKFHKNFNEIMSLKT